MKGIDLELGINIGLGVSSLALLCTTTSPDLRLLSGMSTFLFGGSSLGYLQGSYVTGWKKGEEKRKLGNRIIELHKQISDKDDLIKEIETRSEETLQAHLAVASEKADKELKVVRDAYEELWNSYKKLKEQSDNAFTMVLVDTAKVLDERQKLLDASNLTTTNLLEELKQKEESITTLSQSLTESQQKLEAYTEHSEKLTGIIARNKEKAIAFIENQHEKYTNHITHLRLDYQQKLESDFATRSERFKQYRSKLVNQVRAEMQKYAELKEQFDSLLSSQLETVQLLEDHIKTAEYWKDSASVDFEKNINDYELKLKEYQLRLQSAPIAELFNGSDRASHNGNKLISLLHQHGLVCHAAKCEKTKTKDIIWLKPSNCLPSQVQDKAELIQVLFELAKPPIIEHDKGLIKVELISDTTVEIDISKYVKHFTELENIIAKAERIKVDGGSEQGKSPFADNIISIKRNQTRCKVVLSNPLHGSKKDYWKLPATYKSYGEARQGLSDFLKELHQRTTQARTSKELNLEFPAFPFVLYTFDEIDITLEDNNAKKALKEILKTASHYNLGIIFIGQSPYCSEAGLKQADFLNCVQFHIGNVALKAIELSSYSNSLKARLSEEYQKVNRYYADKNRSITDEKLRYRFALVDDARSEPYFIELPPIGFYTCDDSADKVVYMAEFIAESAENTADNPAIEIPLAAVSKVELEPNTANQQQSDEDSTMSYPVCPGCKSANVRKHSARGKGKYQFQCLNDDCSRKFFTLNLQDQIKAS